MFSIGEYSLVCSEESLMSLVRADSFSLTGEASLAGVVVSGDGGCMLIMCRRRVFTEVNCS